MEAQDFINFLSRIDIPTLIPIAFMFWFLKSHQDKKFEKIDKKFEKIDERFEKVEDKITGLDKRLVAIETILHMKECCMLKNEETKKVQ